MSTEALAANSERKGLGLDQYGQRELREIDEALRKNKETYRGNCYSDSHSMWALPAEFEGIDRSIVDELEQGTGPIEGKLRLQWTDVNYWTVLRSAHRSKIRRRFHYTHHERRRANLPIREDSTKIHA